MHRADLFREANELHAWIEVEDDKDGALVQKSGAIDFDKWYREAHEQNTPWGNEDSPAVVTAVESAVERELSLEIMGGDGKPRPKSVSAGDVLVEQGETSEGSSGHRREDT